MALDFPAAPTNGQVFNKWTWDGTTWVLTPGTTTGITQADADIRYVNIPGDTMTGPLTIGTGGPTLSKGSGDLIVTAGSGDAPISIFAPSKRPYYAWYGGTDNARRGYLGYPNTTSNGSMLVAEGGALELQANDIVLKASVGPIYYDASSHIFRSQGGVTDWAHIDALAGIGGIYFTQAGGGLHFTDTTWLRVYGGKNFYCENLIGAAQGMSVSNSGSQSLLGNNWKMAINVGGTGEGASLGVFGQAHVQRRNWFTGSGAGWSARSLVVSSQTGDVNDNCGIGFWSGGTAPILGGSSAGGEKIQVLNQSNTGYAPVWASAFTVTSTARSKENIVQIDDALLLDRTKQVSGVRFRWKVRPLWATPTAEFLARQATARDAGQEVPRPGPQDVVSIDHDDCTLIDCPGTADQPCAAVLNDTDAIGLLAEDLVDIFPEAVMVDETLTPAGIDVAQVAATALATCGALARKIEQLEARIATLEAA